MMIKCGWVLGEKVGREQAYRKEGRARNGRWLQAEHLESREDL